MLIRAPVIVGAELKRRGWKPGERERRRKEAPKTVQIARWLRTKTPLTLRWMATELPMEAWTQVSNLLSRQRRKGKMKLMPPHYVIN